MNDEIMQELWPKFEAEVKKYSEFGPFLAKFGIGETKKEAIKRLKRFSKLAKGKRQSDEMRRLVFREFAILIFMLFHLVKIHKENCGCSYCVSFQWLLEAFGQGADHGKLNLFFNTTKKYNGDVGFRLSSHA